jgi:hypothetical protein
MSDEICIVPGCDRIRDKKQNRKICQMHRTRFGRHKSYDLPTAPKLPDGILKICKKHGELTAIQVYKRIKGKDWLSCRQCVKECGRRFDKKVTPFFRNSYRKNYIIKGTNRKITKEYYQQMLRNQNSVCAICKKPESVVNSPLNSAPKRLAIDHCHKTGIVRGLLCHKCNVSIGAMRESIELLEAAIEYLKHHKT